MSASLIRDLAEMDTCAQPETCSHRYCDLIRRARYLLAERPESEHFCETDEGWRPCPADLCEAQRLFELAFGLTGELVERRACLVGAADDLARVQGAAVEDGGLWLKAVAEERERLVREAIVSTDAALTVVAVLASAGKEGAA